MELLTTAQIARLLNTSTTTVRRMWRDGLYRAYKVRRQLRFNPDEVLAAIAWTPEQAGLTTRTGRGTMVRHAEKTIADEAEEDYIAGDYGYDD